MSTTPARLLGGRYEVGRLIGRGGMAEVHLGHDARLGRPVAIKILRTDHARDATFLHRFRREAQSVAGLNHRSVVAVYDSGEDRITEAGGATLDVPYIVMEYVEGRTLREVLNEEGRLAPDEAARVTGAVLDALSYSHQMGIVHRDIKPGNVMVGDDGAVKVMDFGIARAVADTQATVTQTSAVIGTAQYISPEQARGESVDNRTDIYSTGCLLFELLTGRTPFTGEPIALTYQHVNAAPPLPSELAPEVPEALDAVVSLALTKDRDARYRDADEMEADLDAFRRGMPVSPAAMQRLESAGRTDLLPVAGAAGAAGGGGDDPTTAVTPVVGSSASRGRRRGVIGWVIAGLLLLAVAGLGYYAYQESRPDPVQQVTVGDLVGQTEDDAKAELRAAGLSPEPQSENSEEPQGQVIRQDPAEGTRLDPGEVVTIVVSAGVGETQVPTDLAGKSRGEAEDLLREAGLQLGQVRTEDSKDQARDRVTRSEPGPGEALERGSEVDVWLSTGEVELPDYTGQQIDAVRQQVFELGLTSDVNTVPSDEDPGTILRQEPGEGKVERGTEVVFTVAGRQAPTVTETTTAEPTTPSDDTTTSSEPTTTTSGDETSEPTPTSTSPSPPTTPETPPSSD